MYPMLPTQLVTACGARSNTRDRFCLVRPDRAPLSQRGNPIVDPQREKDIGLRLIRQHDDIGGMNTRMSNIERLGSR